MNEQVPSKASCECGKPKNHCDPCSTEPRTSKEQVCEHTKVFVTDATMRRMQVPCPWCKDAEIERLKQRCNPSKVVMIGKAGHYVSEAVSAEIERMQRELDGANKTIAHFMGPEGEKYIDRFAAMLSGPVSLEESIRKYSASEPEPDESDADTCRLAFQAWANDLGLCLDEIFMSSYDVPEHPYEDNDTNQFWRAWLASWKAKRAAPPPPAVHDTGDGVLIGKPEAIERQQALYQAATAFHETYCPNCPDHRCNLGDALAEINRAALTKREG